jgi:hypothetical protein
MILIIINYGFVWQGRKEKRDRIEEGSCGFYDDGGAVVNLGEDDG